MKKLTLIILLFAAITVHAQQKEIQLYPGTAAGSESWTWNATENDSNAFKEKIIYNVSHPTLTVFPADPAVAATGTAVIICPGGGFSILFIDKEGTKVAESLSKKGITAFVLKYRLEHSFTNDPVKEFIGKSSQKDFRPEDQPVIPLAVADGRAAIAYVRAHAADYSIKPNQVGIMGFSAGGGVAALSAVNCTADNRPDFVAPIYPFLPGSLSPDVPAGSPPLFIAAASDDPLNINDHTNINLYSKWIAAKNSAEIHIYVKGGHGFGMNKQGIPADNWIDQFTNWLNTEGFLKPLSNVKTDAQKRAEDWANFQKLIEYGIHNDWPNLKRYDEDNKKLEAMPHDSNRVIFMGNSITDNWIGTDPDFFKNNPYLDRGIGGQTTPQMLVRFRGDVINLKPAVVVILAGINDIAENTGPSKLENVFGNIASMAELAKANHIRVVLCSVLPAYDFPWHPGLHPIEKIIRLNEMIKNYAAKNGLVYTDYYDAMVDERKGLKKELAADGVVHPNMAGYKVMEPLVQKAINETLKRK